jgi:hypothetical protein
MHSSASPGVASSGARDAGDMAHARSACNTSKQLVVAATSRTASGGGAGFVEICAEISSKARKDERRQLFVHGEVLGGFTVSLAVAVEGTSSACGLLASDLRGVFFGCFFFLFGAGGIGSVLPTSSGVAAARVTSSSAWSSSARVRHAAHSSDIGLVAERQK